MTIHFSLYQEVILLLSLPAYSHFCMFNLLFFFLDTDRFPPKLDANGNCESGDKVSFPLFLLVAECTVAVLQYKD